MANEARLAGIRRNAPLTFKHDAELPISARREEVVAALQRHQVLIVAGDTGSGKSTQLPQYCLEAGRGIDGLIAHTQPRRLAARALAARVAEELSQAVGGAVGFRVRFADQISDATRLVLMTDGLLLAELNADPLLHRYDTVIVDEAHERTLNIDLLFGVLKRILPRRPELKLIVTSATLDVERVARFFDDAPIISVSGRSHPIEVRYATETDSEDPDLPRAVLDAYRDIIAAPSYRAGDILVFLPGEREIRDVGDLLERELRDAVDVLALYSRLSWDQQSRIFQRGTRPRIVLATNVAETSITVPGIRAVIDSGLARISRYSPRNRLQRLPVEPVSRASADQRKGRCGRLGPGLCVRLYAEADFEARVAFTEPEVLRTNLAALLLRLAAEGLGAAEDFPFIDMPDPRALGDGYRVLQELQALNADRGITRLGRAMARLPLDPRLARALIESKRFHAEREVLAIVAGLSVPDARIAAVGDTEVVDANEPFEDNKSEFSGLVKLWRAYRRTREGPRRELRKWCKDHGLSVLRLSEWEDVHTQVVARAAELGIVAQQKPATYTGLHRALLSGFATMVGTRGDDAAYFGTRGIRFHIFPGSPLRRRRPRWIMAANIVETSRVFARRVAEIEPMWVEAAARHLLKREYLEPDWDEGREEVVARERLSFLGLVLSANRVVNYGPIAPEESRLIFAREALVHHRLRRRPAWLERNDRALLDAQRTEERLRSRDLVRAAEFFVEFYDRLLPRQVSSTATLEYFSRHLSDAQRAALTLGPEQIFAREPDPRLLEQFPERIELPMLAVPVQYRFDPGESDDGATLNVPLLALPTLSRREVDGAVPGLAAARVDALLRTLPKEVRRTLIPVAATAASFIERVGAASADPRRLAAWLQEARGLPAALLRFEVAGVPAHLMPRVAVVENGKTLAHGTDLSSLRRRCALRARQALDHRAQGMHPDAWRRFECEELAAVDVLTIAGGTLQVHPTLHTDGGQLEYRYEWSAAEAAHSWQDSGVRLARLVLERQARDLARQLRAHTQLLLAGAGFIRGEGLIDLLLQWTFRGACFEDGEPPRSRAPFEAAVHAGREQLYPTLDAVTRRAIDWFGAARALRQLLDDPRARNHPALREETAAHLSRLLDAQTLSALSAAQMRRLPVYIKAEHRRWQRLLERGSEPAQILREVDVWNTQLATLDAELAAEMRWLPQRDEFRSAIEEYRVSLYAQELKALGPVSAARLEARATEIEAWLRR